jgi:hypothetical protein
MPGCAAAPPSARRAAAPHRLDRTTECLPPVESVICVLGLPWPRITTPILLGVGSPSLIPNAARYALSLAASLAALAAASVRRVASPIDPTLGL